MGPNPVSLPVLYTRPCSSSIAYSVDVHPACHREVQLLSVEGWIAAGSRRESACLA